MMKRSFWVAMFFSACAVLLPFTALGAESATEKLQGTQTIVETLVGAKDEGFSDDIGLRTETFRQVVDLAINEAKNVRLQVLAAERADEVGTSTLAWRDLAVKRLDAILGSYESEKEELKAHEAALTLEDIRARAASFKARRDETYLPLYEEVMSYVLLRKNESALEIAFDRWGRIEKDVAILMSGGLKGTFGLKMLFASTTTHLSAARSSYEAAQEKFENIYIAVDAPAATSTSALPAATSSLDKQTGGAEPMDVSIKGLVKQSFQSVKDAYRIFIEMSSLVRKLLS